MANLSANEVLAIALMGITTTLDPLAIGSGYVLDPSYYIEPPPPPPPPAYIGGGGAATSAGNIAAISGNWLNTKPYWDHFQQSRIDAYAKGTIRIVGQTAVVVIAASKEALELPWQQIRQEDDLLLGVMDVADTPALKAVMDRVDERILKQDDFLLLLDGAMEQEVDDDEVILFI